MWPKILFQIELQQQDTETSFGMEVEAELAEDTDEEDQLRVFVSEVQRGGLAHKRGECCSNAVQMLKVVVYIFYNRVLSIKL